MSATLESTPPQNATPRTWLSPAEAADYLRLSIQSLANMRCTGAGPKFHRRGRVVRYKRTDLDKWLEAAK